MLGRQIVGYLPATVLAPLATFIGLLAYSQLLRPDQYGRAVVVLAAVELIQAIWFLWLRLGLLRFFERAQIELTTDALQATAAVGWLGLAAIASVAYLLGVTFWPVEPGLRSVYYYGLPLLLTKSMLGQCLEWHRAKREVARYSFLEGIQSFLGVTLGLLLIGIGGLDERGIILGSAIGCAVVLAADLPRVLRGIRLVNSNANMLAQLFRFGMPLSLAALLSFIVNSSDRLLIQWFAGDGEVGLYSLGYNLADRSVSMVFIIVTVPAFPLAVLALERLGAEAAKDQYRQTFATLAALALPATAGLAFVARPLSTALLGTRFVDSASEIIPWIALASLIAGVKAHYFDQAFLLRKSTGRMLWTIGPPALANVALNLWWIPAYGIMGAVYSTIIAFALGLALSIGLGRRIFKLPLTFDALFRPAAATAVMLAILVAIPLPAGLEAVILLIAAGIIAYVVAALALNVAGMRHRLLLSYRLHR